MTEQPLALDRHIATIAALDEPVRRDLYQYVVHSGTDVSRDDAAGALHISRALAAFHLDKLVDEGLLETTFRRLTGKTGPGAGRPSKLYRRAKREVAVSLPPRSYELAARLLAQSVVQSDSPDAVRALAEVAREFGTTVGSNARNSARGAGNQPELIAATERELERYGFEPFQDQGVIRLRNCPFHVLAEEHRNLVCGMNLCLMKGMIDGLQMEGIEAVLEPAPDTCCVAFHLD